MTVLVDTSVWSLALRRDAPPDVPELEQLRTVLDGPDLVTTTGLILQELLQGFAGPRAFRGSVAGVNRSYLTPVKRSISAGVSRHAPSRRGMRDNRS